VASIIFRRSQERQRPVKHARFRSAAARRTGWGTSSCWGIRRWSSGWWTPAHNGANALWGLSALPNDLLQRDHAHAAQRPVRFQASDCDLYVRGRVL